MQRSNVLLLALIALLATPLMLSCQTTYPLSLTAVGEGEVSVAGVPRDLPWQGDFGRDAVVRLEALPTSGHDFVRWEGGLSGDSNPVEVTMDGPKTISAVFAPSSAIGVSPTEIDFGDVTLGDSASAVFTVTNAGGGVVNGSATVDAPFTIVPPESYTLSPGQSAAVTVSFTPTEPGDHTAAVAFTGGGGAERPVHGSGVEPTTLESVSLEPSAALLAPEAALALALVPADAIPADVEWRTTGGRLEVDGATATYTAPATSGNHRVWVTSASDPTLAAMAWIVVDPASDSFVGRRVAILGDEVLLTASGATARLQAAVFENGTPLEGAVVNWESSDSAVSVTQDGLVTAMTNVGSATVTASFGAASDHRMVPVAQLAAATRLIERDAVLELQVVGDDLEAVVLQRSAETERLAAGDIIISSAGVLARILSSRVLADEVIVEVDAATLDEAFDRIRLRGQSDPTALALLMDGAGVRLQGQGALTIMPQAFGFDRLECGFTLGNAVEITYTDGRVEFTRVVSFTAEYDKPSPFSTPRLLFQAEVEARMDAVSPSVEVAAGFEGTYECALDVGSYIVPVLSFFGILNVGGNLSPRIGFEVTGRIDGASVSVGGPFAEGVGYDAVVGFEYTGNDARLIDETRFVEGNRGMGVFEFQPGPTASIEMGPFLELGLGATIDVTTIKGVGIDVANPRLSAVFSVQLSPPFAVEDQDYAGPYWDASLRGSVGFGFTLTGNVAKAMKTFGVTVELASVSVPLFEPLVFLQSPTPSVEVSRAIARGTVEITTSGIDPVHHGREVSFFALPSDGGPALLIGSATVSATGSAVVTWSPSAAENGTYSIFAALYDAVFGAVNLPYVTAAIDRPNLTVDIRSDDFYRMPRLAGGFNYGLRIRDDGRVAAWGANSSGQLGDGTQIHRSLPITAVGVNDAIAVAAGENAPFSLALGADGTVWAWGEDASCAPLCLEPKAIENLGTAVAIAAGDAYALAVLDDGSTWGWGSRSDGVVEQTSVPVEIAGLFDIVSVAAGGRHALALRSDGAVFAWGDNSSGQLGDGSTTSRSVPVQVAGLTEVIAVAAGSSHSVALRGDGTVWTWGENRNGQLGDGTSTNSSEPVKATDVDGVRAIAAGWSHTLALRGDGDVVAWGDNNAGQIEGAPPWGRPTPRPVTGLTDVGAIAAGPLHSIYLHETGSVSVSPRVRYLSSGWDGGEPRVGDRAEFWLKYLNLSGAALTSTSCGLTLVGDGGATYSRAPCAVNERVAFTHLFTESGSLIRRVSLFSEGGRDYLAFSYGTIVVAEGDAEQRDLALDACDVWSATQSGGYGTTIDTWDISMIPVGRTFDIRFDAYGRPDAFVVFYPDGAVALDTGWRGDTSWEGDPRYPGGIAGPGQGQVDGMFTRDSQDWFRVAVTGPDPNTAWQYEVRCR